MVDGSNLATEGRTLPSLKQLDEAVRAYAAEDPGSSIIVVVDATFEHRVSEAEREEVREAMLNGEIISPPAGAIGRGTRSCCGSPSGPVPSCCPTTRSRNSTGSTPGSSTRGA